MRNSAGAAACLVTVLAALVASVASAQDVFVTLCRTHFTVTDSAGRLVTDLEPGDITVYDNGVPQHVADFSRHLHAPVHVALLLDRSQSVSDRFPFLSASAVAFERSVLRDRDDRGMVVAFDSKVYLLHGWTADAAALGESIRTLTPAGGTSIFDAIFKTCRDGFDVVDARQNVIVLITDGEDTTSAATFDQALEMATLSRVVVYVVGVKAEGSMNTREWQGRRVLSSLAALTGGRVFYPDEQRQQDVGTSLAQVQEEMRSAYSLTYYLDMAPDNSFHEVRIEARNKSFTVHAPSGYYARALPPLR